MKKFLTGAGVASLLLLCTAAAWQVRELVLTGDADAGGHQIANLGTPTNASNAATMGWVTNNFLGTNFSSTTNVFLPVAARGATNGVASLGTNGLVPTNQLPPLAPAISLTPGPNGLSPASSPLAAAGLAGLTIDIFTGPGGQNFGVTVDRLNRIWTASFNTDAIKVFSKNGLWITYFSNPSATGRAFDAHDAFGSVFTSHYEAGKVTRWNYDFTVAATIDVGGSPQRMFSDQRFLYVVCSENPGTTVNDGNGNTQSTLYKIDPATNEVVDDIEVGFGAYGGAWVPGTKWAVVSNSGNSSHSLMRIDLDTFEVDAEWVIPDTDAQPMDVSVMGEVVGAACMNGQGTGYVVLYNVRTGALVGQFEGGFMVNAAGTTTAEKGYPYTLWNDGAHWFMNSFRVISGGENVANLSLHAADGTWLDTFYAGANHIRDGIFDGRFSWIVRAGTHPALLRLAPPVSPGDQATGVQFFKPEGSTETFDFRFGDALFVDLSSATGDITPTISSPVAGHVYRLTIKQGGTPRTLTWPDGTRINNAADTTWTSAASTTRTIFTVWNDGVWFLTDPQQGGSGDVVGPSSAADNQLLVSDGTTGKALKSAAVSVSADGSAVFGSEGAAVETSTPLSVSFGSTYGNSTPGSSANLKWKLFAVAGAPSFDYGIGMTENLMEIRAGLNADVAIFANNGTLALRTHTDGSVALAGTRIFTGSGSPEGVVTATAPAVYINTAGPDYYKATGSGNTGWSAK